MPSRNNTANQPKANYRQSPISNQFSSLPPTRDAATAGSMFTTSTVVERNRYKLPTDPALRFAIRTLRLYLDEMQIEQEFNALSGKLLNRPDLPYNPYPGFVRRMRVFAEQFHVFKQSDEHIRQVTACNYEHSHIAYIMRIPKMTHVWAFGSIVKVLNPTALLDFQWLLQDLVPKQENFMKEADYSHQALVALVGPAVFYGSFYPHALSVDVRLEFLITGPLIKMGVKMFVHYVVKDMLNMNMTKHVFLGATVPVKVAPDSDEWTTQFWTKEMINDNQKQFVLVLGDAVIGSKQINAECLFCMDPDTRLYRRGQKQFVLNFVKVKSDAPGVEDVHYFSEYALSTLHEGVFMMQSHAEGYLSIFASRLQIINRGDDARASKSSPVSKPKKSGSKTKVTTDGFRVVGDGPDPGPNAWQITAPIISGWQKKIAALDPIADIYDIAYYMLLLTLINKEAYNQDVVTEIYRLLHSTGARLHALIKLNKTLRELALKFNGNLQKPVVQDQFLQFQRGIREIFNDDMQERSADLKVAGETICAKLDEILQLQEAVTPLTDLPKRTLELLKNVNSYSQGVLLGLIEDVYPFCEHLSNAAETLHLAHSEEVIRPQTGIRDRRKGRTGVKAGEGTKEIYKHGVENEMIRNHDKSVINVEMCMARDSAPKVVAMESVLLKYVLDTRLEEVWVDFVMAMVASEYYPPNPYPSFISKLRESAVRMDLCFETKEKITVGLLHQGARSEGETNFVHHLPGCDAHGDECALQVLDSGAWFKIAKHVQPLINSTFPQKKGVFRIAMCAAVNGGAVHYGKLDPYVTEIVLHEHCYMRGPDGCHGEAIQLYSKIVFEDIFRKFNAKEVPTFAVFLGHEKTKWGVAEMFKKKKGFVFEFERLLEKREPVYFKMFMKMDWGYIAVLKYYKLHYVNQEETQCIEFFPYDPAEYYRNVFFDKEKAAFYYQYSGSGNPQNPRGESKINEACQYLDKEITCAQTQHDWLTVYRLLLQRNLMHQGTCIVPEAWRVFHSMGRQVDYVISLGRSLQDLIRFQLDRKSMGIVSDQLQPGKADNDVVVDPLEVVMTKMVMAFRQKVEHILNSPRTMGPRYMTEYIVGKIQKITERDHVTQELFVTIAVPSVFVLEEIVQLLSSLRDALLYDVHSINTEAQAVLSSIRAECGTQARNARESTLANYREIQRVPQAIVNDCSDMWSV